MTLAGISHSGVRLANHFAAPKTVVDYDRQRRVSLIETADKTVPIV